MITMEEIEKAESINPKQLEIGHILRFNEKTIRRSFIRKVFLILTFQLIISILLIAPLVLYEPISNTLRTDTGLVLAACSFFLIMTCFSVCCIQLVREFPLNYITLALLTISSSWFVGCVCVHYNVKEILIAAGVTTGLFFLLFLFATQSKIDFTPFTAILFAFAVLLMSFGIIAIFFHSKILTWIIIFLAIFIICCGIIIHIQMIVGGKHRYQLSPEDFALAVVLIYIDIILLFVWILRLTGAPR